MTEHWHASLGTDPLAADTATGEPRVPIALHAIDQFLGTVHLVLSRVDATRMCAALARALAGEAAR